MTWEDTRLTTKEQEKALREAGINPDGFAEWTPLDVERAETVLTSAMLKKLEGKRQP